METEVLHKVTSLAKTALQSGVVDFGTFNLPAVLRERCPSFQAGCQVTFLLQVKGRQL